MSWKFGAIYLKRNFSSDPDQVIELLGLKQHYTGKEINLYDALSADFFDTAIGFINNVTLVHNNLLPLDCAFEPDKFYEFDKELATLSTRMEIGSFWIDEMTNTFGFSLFADGKRERCMGTMAGKMVLDEGSYLQAELKLPEQAEEESRIFAIIESFIGISFQDLLQKEGFLLRWYKKHKAKGE